LKIELRYDLQFFEIGTEGNHVHFLIQSVPMNSPKKIISTVKGITAKEIFRIHPEVKRFYGEEIFGQLVIMLVQLVSMRMKK
jgi:putative transposase